MLPPEIWIVILSLIPEMLDVVKLVNHQMQDVVHYLQKGKCRGNRRICGYNAAKNGHISLVKWIIEESRMKVCKNIPIKNIFKGAVEGGHIAILEWLLNHDYLVWLKKNQYQYDIGVAAKDVKTLEWIHDNLYSRYCIISYELFLCSLKMFSKEGNTKAMISTIGYIPLKNTKGLQKALWEEIAKIELEDKDFIETLI